MKGEGFRAKGGVFKGCDLGFRVQEFGCDLGFRVQESGLRFRVQGA